jgi:hypothetical protein
MARLKDHDIDLAANLSRWMSLEGGALGSFGELWGALGPSMG